MMVQDPRLGRLMAGVSDILGVPVPDEHSTIGDLGIDSESLFEVALICEAAYGGAIDFERIEVGYNTTLLGLHQQLVEATGGNRG